MNSVPPKIHNKRAIEHLLFNLLVLPGFGTWTAGRRVQGVAQMVLSILGSILTFVWIAVILYNLTRVDFNVLTRDGNQLNLVMIFTPFWQGGLSGVGCFFIAWIWSLISSLCEFKKS